MKPSPYKLPEALFPNRLERVRKTGVEIADTIGIRVVVGGGIPAVAAFLKYEIIYFTAFNQPKGWLNCDWQAHKARLFRHGLTVSDDRGTLLRLFWDRDGQEFRSVRDPSKDDWDRTLCRRWKKFMAEATLLDLQAAMARASAIQTAAGHQVLPISRIKL